MKNMKCIVVKSLFALLLLANVAFAADPLPSWNDTASKKAIVAFVEKVTKEGSPDFVPVAERIATFDNDGTLWAEQPMYFQLLFALDRVKALAPQHPEWKDKEPFASLLKGDVKGALAGGEPAMLETRHGHARRHDHRGVRANRQGLDRHREASRRPGGPTPRWSISRCSNCSPTCGRTASRPSSSPAAASSSCARGRRRSMASRPSRSSAAASRRSSRLRDGKPVLVRLPEINFIDDKAGKPVGINQHIGRRPIAAFGNSDGDLQMLQWTTAGNGAALRPHRPPHRRRARVGLRPHIARRPARQGARRGAGERLDRRRHEERLEGDLSVPNAMRRRRAMAGVGQRRR